MSSIVQIAKHETKVTTLLSYPPLDPLSSWEYHVKFYRYEYTRCLAVCRANMYSCPRSYEPNAGLFVWLIVAVCR